MAYYKCWITNNPLIASDGTLAPYTKVKLVILELGLAFKAIWIVQFPEQYHNVPAYIVESLYPFSKYKQLSHCTEDLASGCAET